jgi:hypothetical protein
VPLPGLEKLPIPRQHVNPADGKLSLEHDGILMSWYPFDTLPLLESHLRPEFVIFDAGYKLADSDQNLIQELVDVFTLRFSSIMALYSAWIRPPPAKAKEDPTYNVPDDARDSRAGDSYEDEVRNNTVRPRRKKLFKSSLPSHNEEFWTVDRIREWSKPLPDSEEVLKTKLGDD